MDPLNNETINNCSHTLGKNDKTVVVNMTKKPQGVNLLNKFNDATNGNSSLRENDLSDDVVKNPSSTIAISLDNNEEGGAWEESTPLSIIDVETNTTSKNNEAREELALQHKLDDED